MPVGTNKTMTGLLLEQIVSTGFLLMLSNNFILQSDLARMLSKKPVDIITLCARNMHYLLLQEGFRWFLCLASQLLPKKVLIAIYTMILDIRLH